VVVAETNGSAQLERAGVGRDALARTAVRLLEGAPGFVAPGAARSSTRRLLGQLYVQRAEAFAGPSGAVAHVVVTLELRPAQGDSALRETGRAAEPVGAGAGALGAALERATTAALERSVSSFAIQFAAEQKRTSQLVEDLASPEASVRDHAVRVLAERGERDAVPALVGRLRDQDPEVADRAVGALAQLRDPRAVAPLIELGRHREGPYVANLAHILGDIGGPDARAWLLTMASGHPDEVVRGAAREALVEMDARAPQAQAQPSR